MSSILLSAKKTPIMEIEDMKKTINNLQQNLSNLSLKLTESNNEEMHSIINANVTSIYDVLKLVLNFDKSKLFSISANINLFFQRLKEII